MNVEKIAEKAQNNVDMDRVKVLKRIKISPELRAAVENLQELYEQVRGLLYRDKNTRYATTNESELLAEFSNYNVRYKLKSASVWRKLVDTIVRIIDELANCLGVKRERVSGEKALSDILNSFLSNFDKRAFHKYNTGFNEEVFRTFNTRQSALQFKNRGEDNGAYFATPELAPDMSDTKNAKAFKAWLKERPQAPVPEWLEDGSPQAVFEWFEKNMVGRTFAFDIPGYGHREFKVAPGHIGKLVCEGPGKGIITKQLSKGWMDAVRNGEVEAKDVKGWDVKRARMLPRVPVILDSFDAVVHEFDTRHNVDVFVFVKKFETKNGRSNTIVMKLVDDGKTIGPVSTHVKDMTISWLKNKDLILTEGGEVYSRSADNSASRQPLERDNAERISRTSADNISQTDGEINGTNAEQKITSDEVNRIIEHYGTTSSINEAGYILPDGRMLDLSGKNEGAPGGRRTLNHRDVLDVLDDRANGGDAMMDFMSCGAIRIAPESGGIHLVTKPNNAQTDALTRFIRHNDGAVEVNLMNPNGDIAASASYEEGTLPQRVLNEIRRYYDEGVEPRGTGEQADGTYVMFSTPELDPRARAEEIDTHAKRYLARHQAAKRLAAPSPQDIMDFSEGKWSKFRRAVQDKNLLIRELEERLGVTDKVRSVYYAKDREFGLNEHQLTVLQKQHVEPIFERLAKTGASQEDFDLYLIARHAPYRNGVILGRTGTKDGSGMSDADAVAVIDKFKRLGLEPEFSAIADMVYAMNDEALQRRVDSGRITQDMADDLRATLVDYVPLRTDMENAERETFNTYSAGWHKNEFRTAKGRETLADSPLAWSIVQAERSIKDANANEVRKIAAELVRHAARIGTPIGEIVSGTQMKKRWAFDIGGEVWTMDELKDRPNIIFFKEDGKFRAVVMKEGKNNLGNVFAQSVTDKDLAQFNEWFEWVPKLTRAMAAMRTQYVPTFIVRNMKADTLEVMLNVLSERGAKDGMNFMGRLLANEWKSRRDVKDYFKTGEARGRMKEFVENGGLTGGGMSAEGFSEAASRIRNTLKTARGGNVRKFAAAIPDAISLLNACAEYNTRVGIYSTLRDEGVSVEDAVSYARDATVNFNRRGYLTPYINAAFMFSNASIQGMSRAFKAMRSKYGKGTIAALFMTGVIQTLLDYFLGQDDDREKQGLSNARNLSEHEKLTSIGVPMPYGLLLKTQIRNPWALPMYLGRKITETIIGWSKPKDAATDVVSAIGSFITGPVGGNGFDSISQTWQTFAPTLADPLVQWMTGKDFKGDDRLRKSFDKYKPDAWNGKYNTANVYKWIAQLANWASGGSEYRKGALDTAPENWQLLAETVFGGALTDLNRVVSTVKNVSLAVQGAKPDQVLRDIPFVRDTITNMPDVSRRFYEALDDYEADIKEYRGITDAKEKFAFFRSHPWVDRGDFKELVKRIKNNQKREQGFEKIDGKWVPHDRKPAEKLAYRRWRLADEAKFVALKEEATRKAANGK